MERWHTQNELQAPFTCDHRFVARQPIFDRQRNTFGYELLFRSSWANFFSGEAESASLSVIDDTLAFGVDSLVGDTAPFINCTYNALVDDIVSLLPPGTVLEVLETVTVDEALIKACRKLVANGYLLALDDFDFSPRWEPLLPLASFIKVDFLASTPEQRNALISRLNSHSVQFIAEKIEDEEAFQNALHEGFHLFQGYFFARPVVVARPALASVMQRMRLFAKLRKPELNTTRLLALLKEEPAISLRVLRLANTAMMGPRGVIKDLRTALVVIGESRFRKLALAALATEVTGGHTTELHERILQRGRFCESVASQFSADAEQLFFFGILSVIKPILELSQKEINSMITLDAAMMDALAGEQNRYSLLLQSLSDFEEGKWSIFSKKVGQLGLQETAVAECFRRSQWWAHNVIFDVPMAA